LIIKSNGANNVIIVTQLAASAIQYDIATSHHARVAFGKILPLGFEAMVFDLYLHRHASGLFTGTANVHHSQNKPDVLFACIGTRLRCTMWSEWSRVDRFFTVLAGRSRA